MKKTIILISLIWVACVSQAQIKVSFPEDFTHDLIGKEIAITNALIVTNTYNIEKYGGVYLSGKRLWIPTEKEQPGKDMFARLNKENAANQLLLKGALNAYIDEDGTCRTGQTVSNIIGTVTYESGKYAITPTQQPVFTGNERPTTTDDMNLGNYNLKIASFNIQNYGEKTEYLPTQRNKITKALQALDADIYVLAEVWGDNALDDLCSALNEIEGSNHYHPVKHTSNHTLITSFIYNNSKVTPYKDIRKNTKVPVNTSNPAAYLPERKVAQAFELIENGERFIISANHWKSKSGSATGQEDQLDGQGSYNPRRIQEAEATVAFINELIDYYDDPDVLIVGDLNAYSCEDPIRALTNAGFVNELQKYSPAEYSYSYSTNGYNGVGYLDHSLSSPSLSEQVVYATPFHINADEPAYLRLIINNSLNPEVKLDMYKSSDHDPIITTLYLDSSTGINNNSRYRPTIGIYGNPRDGYVTLHGEGIFKAEIITISGQTVSQHQHDNAASYLTLPLTGLNSGFYLIRIYSGNYNSTHKIVIP